MLGATPQKVKQRAFLRTSGYCSADCISCTLSKQNAVIVYSVRSKKTSVQVKSMDALIHMVAPIPHLGLISMIRGPCSDHQVIPIKYATINGTKHKTIVSMQSVCLQTWSLSSTLLREAYAQLQTCSRQINCWGPAFRSLSKMLDDIMHDQQVAFRSITSQLQRRDVGNQCNATFLQTKVPHLTAYCL